MRRKIPSTSALNAFEAAARHASFTEAANELALTQSAICRQIAGLEAFLGVKLVYHAMHVNEQPFLNGGEHIEWAPEISTWMSLGVIVVAMTVATIASLIASARDKRREATDAAAPAAIEHHD